MSVIAAIAALAAVMTAPLPAAAHDGHALAAGAVRGDSIYALATTLVDQASRPVGLDVFRGRPVLVTMFYGTCQDACPLLVADLLRIERQVPPRARARLGVVLVSLDLRDTPAALAGLARAHHVDERRWRFLTARDEDTVREVAAVLGVKYRRLADGHFNHSSLITLLDGDGVVVERVEGLNQPAARLVERLRGLLDSSRSSTPH